MSLAEKYAPTTLNQVVGNWEAVERLVKFGIEAHRNTDQKPLLIYGPSGVGKTAAVHALAYSNGFELLELNASDYRDAETLNRTLLPASGSRGLFNKKVLIFLDEIDERSEKFDSGFEQVMLELIKTSRHPIVVVADDYWSRRISFLRDRVERLEFKRVGRDEILKLLKTVLKKERKQIDESIVEEIASRSNGDIRGAMNDLEIMIDARPELIENLGMRDRKLEIFGVLDKVFLSKNFETARNAYTLTDLDSDMLMNWIDENIPNRYSLLASVANAYSNIAKASFFMEHAKRNNYYSYLRYAGVLMSSGVALSGSCDSESFRTYAFPATIRQLSKTKAGRSAISGVLTKLVYRLHVHKKNIFNEYLHLLKDMIDLGCEECGEEQTVSFFEKFYSLDKKDLEVIRNYS